VLAAESDYNEYCYYVAGTVGHMATDLVVAHYRPAQEVASRLTAACEACGRGPQKTNILKDFAEDLGSGISYLPLTWRREAHFLALPYDAAGYRMASLMPLLPAYQTLLLTAQRLDTLFTSGHHVKISRRTMVKCQWDARSMLADNDAVMQYGRRLEGEIEAIMAENGARRG
jgi:farnesyl-diphosphate farnesyltransferase